MVSPLVSKNTLEQTGFALTTTGMKYHGNFYDFDQVVETRAVRQVVEQRNVLVNSKYHYAISIVMVLKSGLILQVTEQPTMFSDSSQNKVEYIEDLYKEISNRTWDARIAKYINQVNEKSFFEYAGWRFYTKSKTIEDLKSGKKYALDLIDLLKNADCLIVQERNNGFGMKLLKSFTFKPISIITMTDTDVLFFILRHYFDLEWK